MDYLIKLLENILDKTNEAKGYALGKKLKENIPKPVFKNNTIKFRDIQNLGREASTNEKKERVDASMNKKPTLGSIKKLKNKDLYRGRFQYKGIVYTTTAKKFIDCFNKHEEKIKLVKAEYESTINTNRKVGFDKNTLLKDWYDYWYKTYKESDTELKQSTRYSYETYYRAYFKDSDLFKIKLGKVTTFDVQSFIDSIKAVSSKKRAKIYLNACYKKAIETGIITFNPISAVAKINSKKETRKKYLTDDEVYKILGHCKNNPDPIYQKYHNLYYFLWNTGLRIGEALALTWSDIDLNNGYIKVRKAFNDKFKTIDTPKTPKSFRNVPIFKNVKNLLENMDKSVEYIFGELQQYQTRDYASMIGGRIGIKFTNHMFRHTFSSNCIAKGINPKTVQKWLGHTKLSMTMDTYVDVIDELEQIDINKYND